MPETSIARNDAIERVLDTLRERLEAAFANKQRVRIDARDNASSRSRVPVDVFAKAPLTELLKAVESDGSFECHIYIEPKR